MGGCAYPGLVGGPCHPGIPIGLICWPMVMELVSYHRYGLKKLMPATASWNITLEYGCQRLPAWMVNRIGNGKPLVSSYDML
jgi:hypothetical protein